MKLDNDQIEELRDWVEDKVERKYRCPFGNINDTCTILIGNINDTCTIFVEETGRGAVIDGWRCKDTSICQETFKRFKGFTTIISKGKWDEINPNCPCIQLGAKRVVNKVKKLIKDHELQNK